MTAPATTPEERARESAAAIRFRVRDSLVFETKAPLQDEAHEAARPNGALQAVKEASAAVGALAADARAQQVSAADATIATAARRSAAPQAPTAPQTPNAATQAPSGAKPSPNGAKQSRADGEGGARPVHSQARELQELRATIQALELSSRVLELEHSCAALDARCAQQEAANEELKARFTAAVAHAAKRSDAAVEKLTQQEKQVVALEAAGSQRERRIAELTATLQEVANEVIALRAKPSPGTRAVNAPTAAADAAKPVSAPRPRARSGHRMLVAMGRGSGASYTLKAGETTIGRSHECDIQIDSKYLSRQHARIAVRDTEVFIEDLASRNGVRVNSKLIEKSAPLKDGDIILLGVLELQYVDVGSARRRAGVTVIQPARVEVASIQPAPLPTEPAPTPIR